MIFQSRDRADLRAVCEEHDWKVGDLFMAIRVALTGRTATPPIFDVMSALGYEITLDRLEKRMWLAVYGAASLVLADVAYGLVRISTQ